MARATVLLLLAGLLTLGDALVRVPMKKQTLDKRVLKVDGEGYRQRFDAILGNNQGSAVPISDYLNAQVRGAGREKPTRGTAGPVDPPPEDLEPSRCRKFFVEGFCSGLRPPCGCGTVARVFRSR